VLAAIDPTPLPNKKNKKAIKAEPKQKMIHDQLETNNQDKVLQEIRNMKKWMEHQSKQNVEFPLPYQNEYEKLLDQEVDQQIAHELIETIYQRNQHDEKE